MRYFCLSEGLHIHINFAKAARTAQCVSRSLRKGRGWDRQPQDTPVMRVACADLSFEIDSPSLLIDIEEVY